LRKSNTKLTLRGKANYFCNLFQAGLDKEEAMKQFMKCKEDEKVSDSKYFTFLKVKKKNV